LYVTSVKEDSTSIEVARYDLFDDVCEISDDPPALDTRVTRLGTAVSDQDDVRRFRSPVVVADWVDPNSRGEGHKGWLMLTVAGDRSEEHTSELQSRFDLVCRLLLERTKVCYNTSPC